MMLTAIRAALILVVLPFAGALAQTLSPSPVSEDTITVAAKDGKPQTVRVSIQAWAIEGQDQATQEIPLRGFYVAHLVSGQISATLDGQTAKHLPGDYWTVRSGGTMEVKVSGEVAVLETTVVTKQ